MSTTKQFTNIKSGKRHQIDATARGYYDFRTTVVPQPSKSLSFDMRVYDGLKYDVDLSKNSVRPGEINFDGTVLPYIENNTLTKTNYCFGNSGTNYDLPVYEEVYDNITKVGDVAINNGIASNFSASDYLSFPRNKFTGNETIVLKFKLNTIKNCAIFHCEHFVSAEISETSLICYNWQQSTAQTILDSVETNKWYWVKVEITDLATRKYSISTDGVTYIEKLSTIDTSAVLTYQSYNYMYIGNSSFDASVNAVNGSIDLNESKITIGENIINLGDYSLQKQYTGYTTYGNVKVNNLVCSGFDSSSKVILSNAKFNTSEPIYISFAMGPDVSTRQKIFDTDDRLSFRIENGYFWYYKNENHTWIQWKSINANTGYKIKAVIKSSNNYSLGLTPINEDAYDYIDVTDTLNLTNGPVGIGANLNDYNQPFQGTIDISEIPGAYELKTESKPGIFYNYEDAGQSAELNCFSKSNELVVLSSDENITDHTWLGKVNIPEHRISWN